MPQFKCNKSNICVDLDKQCDGNFDCPDHSDEVNCGSTKPCSKPHQFLCDNRVCLNNQSLVCNHVDDCGDFSDEKSCGKCVR